MDSTLEARTENHGEDAHEHMLKPMIVVLLAAVMAIAAGCGQAAQATPAPDHAGMSCVEVEGVIDTIRWAPNGLGLLVGTTDISGRTGIVRLDGATLDVEPLEIGDPLLESADIALGDDGTVYYGHLGDYAILAFQDGAASVATVPSVEDWSFLARTRSGFVVTNYGRVGSSVLHVEPDGGAVQEIYRTRELISGLWASEDDTTVVVTHYPVPEEAPVGAAVSIVTLTHGEVSDVTFVQGAFATSPSLLASTDSIYFIDADRSRLGVVSPVDGSVGWLMSDVDVAEVSALGGIAVGRRTQDPGSDLLCVGDATAADTRP